MGDAFPDREMPNTELATLKRRIAELEQALREEHDGRLRALADFENYRRRTEREAGGPAEPARARSCCHSWTCTTTWNAPWRPGPPIPPSCGGSRRSWSSSAGL